VRPPNENGKDKDKDEDRSDFRHKILASSVRQSDGQRRHKRSLDVAKTADGNHDQKVDDVLERIGRSDGEHIGTQTTAQRSQAGPETESSSKQPTGIDADR